MSVSYSVVGWKTGWSGFWWVCLSTVRSDNQRFVWFVDSVVVLRMVGQSVGQSVTWAVDGLVEWLMASLVCRSVVCLLC